MDQWNKPLLGSRIDWGHPLSKGLVGCWLMNEGSGNRIYDISGNGNDGDFVNDPEWVPGQRGQAIFCDGGNDYIDCGNNPALNATPFSLVVWVTLGTGALGWNVIAAKETWNAGEGWFLYSSFAQNKLFLSKGGDQGAVFVDPDPLVDYMIHNIVATYDGTSGRIYVDGQLRKTAGLALIMNVNRSLLIGARHGNAGGGSADYWKGQIHFCNFYNRALSAQEVLDLYINPYGMFEDRPKLFYIANDPVRTFIAEPIDTHFIAEPIDTHFIAEAL